MIDAAAREILHGPQVQIKADARVFAAAVHEVRGHVRLIGTLVLRETNVAIDAHHGAPRGMRIGDKSIAHFREARRQVRDQGEKRLAYILFITLLVRQKPIAIIVLFQIVQKFEKSRTKINANWHTVRTIASGSILARARCLAGLSNSGVNSQLPARAIFMTPGAGKWVTDFQIDRSERSGFSRAYMCPAGARFGRSPKR